jgi:hypothetical protein
MSLDDKAKQYFKRNNDKVVAVLYVHEVLLDQTHRVADAAFLHILSE